MLTVCAAYNLDILADLTTITPPVRAMHLISHNIMTTCLTYSTQWQVLF